MRDRRSGRDEGDNKIGGSEREHPKGGGGVTPFTHARVKGVTRFRPDCRGAGFVRLTRAKRKKSGSRVAAHDRAPWVRRRPARGIGFRASLAAKAPDARRSGR